MSAADYRRSVPAVADVVTVTLSPLRLSPCVRCGIRWRRRLPGENLWPYGCTTGGGIALQYNSTMTSMTLVLLLYLTACAGASVGFVLAAMLTSDHRFDALTMRRCNDTRNAMARH